MAACTAVWRCYKVVLLLLSSRQTFASLRQGRTKFSEMKHIKPAQVYSAVISICAFLLVLLLFRQLWNLSSSNFKNSADDIRAIQISKDSLLPSFYGDEDPFTKGNYLNKKFLQLVASTHLTLQSSSGQSKNATKSFDYVYFTNELMVTINVKNFYARWLGCKNIAAIQVT